jgi:hypothetical protein
MFAQCEVDLIRLACPATPLQLLSAVNHRIGCLVAAQFAALPSASDLVFMRGRDALAIDSLSIVN